MEPGCTYTVCSVVCPLIQAAQWLLGGLSGKGEPRSVFVLVKTPHPHISPSYLQESDARAREGYFAWLDMQACVTGSWRTYCPACRK